MLITVFTPTYNRAKLLPRLYHSLQSQTCKEFEWIVVDDESKDHTEAIVKSFQEEDNPFPIIFLKQSHGGKHRAFNLAVQQARGDYFFTVDSDDWLPDNAVELLTTWIGEIKGISKLCGVAGQKVLKDGTAVGSSFTSGERFIDASSLDTHRLHITGDKAETVSTSVLRTHLFPEFDGEYFVTEDVCWNAIAADGYHLRWYQEPVYYCEYLEDGLSRTGANDLSGHVSNFRGYSYYIRQCLKVKNKLDSYRDYVDFQKTCDAMKLPESERAEALQWSMAQYIFQKRLVMPVVHNIKRVIYVTGKAKALLSR